MRVLILTPSFLPYVGGLETVLDHLARALQLAGHEVCLSTEQPRGSARPLPSLPYEARARARAWSQRGGYAGWRRAVRAWHRERAFDVVSAHMAYPAGWVAWRLQEEIGVPAVVTCHGGDVSARSRYRRRPRIMQRLAEALEGSAAVTAVSAELARATEEIAPGARCDVVPNGVDPAIAEPVERPADAAALTRPFALYLKRFHEAKGHEALIRCWADLVAGNAATPDLVLAGDGPRLEPCRALVETLGLQGRVHFPGPVEDPLRRWLLQSCCVFVHPSSREGMPVVILEAMTCGRPVVAVRAEGVASMVDPDRSGAIAEPGDEAGLRAALRRAFDPRRAAAWGAAGRERAEAFTWSRVARRYAELFAAVAAAAGAR